ncbi:ALQxL family class IV lanthipeptide [Streptomyces sp. NPDC005438]
MLIDVDALQELDGEENAELGGCTISCAFTCAATVSALQDR